MNTEKTVTTQQWQDQEALRRFQLISPLLQTGLDDAQRLYLRKKTAEENNISIRTLYRYEKAFSEGQFAGLRPADRENTVPSGFRPTSIFCWNRRSSSAGKFRNALFPRSFTSWRQRDMPHPAF